MTIMLAGADQPLKKGAHAATGKMPASKPMETIMDKTTLCTLFLMNIELMNRAHAACVHGHMEHAHQELELIISQLTALSSDLYRTYYTSGTGKA